MIREITPPARLLLVSTACLILCGCDQKQQKVEAWLNAEIAGTIHSTNGHYPIPGVSRYTVVAYKTLKSADGIVTVQLTFKSSGGADILSTHNFRVNDAGKVELIH